MTAVCAVWSAAPLPDEEDEGDAGLDGAETTTAGRSAKRARQRERRRMFKAAAREGVALELTGEKGDALDGEPAIVTSAKAAASPLSQGSGLPMTHVPPGTWSTLPARTSGLPMKAIRSTGSAQEAMIGAGGGMQPPGGYMHGRPPGPTPPGKRDVPFQWQPPGIWEPARIVMKEDISALSADPLIDDDDILEDAAEVQAEVIDLHSSTGSNGWRKTNLEAASHAASPPAGGLALPRKLEADKAGRGAETAPMPHIPQVDHFTWERQNIVGAAAAISPAAVVPSHDVIRTVPNFPVPARPSVEPDAPAVIGIADVLLGPSAESGAPASAGAGQVGGAVVNEAFLGVSAPRTRKDSLDSAQELNNLVEELVAKEEASRSPTDPWSGRPVADSGISMMGLGGGGNGKPLNGEEAHAREARFGDANAGMGMGRGRRLAPPPGFGSSAYRGLKAPGGLSKEWRPEPPIPEEELDPENPGTPAGYWRSDAELPSRLLYDAASTAAARFGSDYEMSAKGYCESSKASYCGTPSMAWSKTPDDFSPPGTPLMLSRGMPDWNQPAMQLGAAYGDHMSPGGLSGAVPMYVTVPVTHSHNCPHCGRGFALAPDALASPQGYPTSPSSSGTPPGLKVSSQNLATALGTAAVAAPHEVSGLRNGADA